MIFWFFRGPCSQLGADFDDHLHQDLWVPLLGVGHGIPEAQLQLRPCVWRHKPVKRLCSKRLQTQHVQNRSVIVVSAADSWWSD